MKRSEFLQTLYDNFDLAVDKPENLKKNVIDLVIEEAEKLGMLAPSVPTGASGWEVGKGMPSYVNEWEPED